MKQSKQIITLEDGKEVEALAPIILSVSRATDVPAFYADWFFNRFEAGYCRWRNPFNGVDSYVSFQNVRFIVFWSKNPAPLLPYLEKLKKRGIKCYIQYTLNDYDAEQLEPGVPVLPHRIETFKELVGSLGKGSVVWRFDPLILTDTICISQLIEKIERAGDELKDYAEKLVFSFADIAAYRKVGRNLSVSGVNWREWTELEMLEFARHLSELNKRKDWNLQLATCAEKIDLSEYGIFHNKCVDDELIARIAWKDSELMKYLGIEIKPAEMDLFGSSEIPKDAIILDENRYGIRTKRNRDTGQRALCGCITSKDIGQYNTCPHGCLYCYANTSPEAVKANYSKHSPYLETILPC